MPGFKTKGTGDVGGVIPPQVPVEPGQTTNPSEPVVTNPGTGTTEPTEPPPITEIPEPTKVKSDSAKKQSKYLSSLNGQKFIVGQHTTTAGNPYRWVGFLGRMTFAEPGVWSAKIEDDSSKNEDRKKILKEAGIQLSRGVIIQLEWEPCSPVQEGCDTRTALNDDQWEKIFEEGSEIQKTWFARLDRLGTYLEPMKGKTFVLRMMPRLNSKAGWWGGSAGSAKLFELSQRYLNDKVDLTSTLFAWDVDNLSAAKDFQPRAAFYDLASASFKTTPPSIDAAKEFQELSPDKPIVVGNLQGRYSAEYTNDSPWSYIVAHDAELTKHNTRKEIRALYKSGKAITNKQKPAQQ